MAPQMDGESYWMRGVHKCQAQPLVPLGIAATVGFFAASMRQFMVDTPAAKARGNKLLRGRVAAQGFTMIVVVYSLYAAGGPSNAIKAPTITRTLE